MTKMLIVLGVTIAALPHLGLPASWDTVLMTVGGILVVLLALALRRVLRTALGTHFHSTVSGGALVENGDANDQRESPMANDMMMSYDARDAFVEEKI